MKRGHTAKIFLDLVKELRKRIPEITIATDIITGFPSESERDFEETLSLIEECQPDIVNSSRFSPRPGTVASKYPRLNTKDCKRKEYQTTSNNQENINEKKSFMARMER